MLRTMLMLMLRPKLLILNSTIGGTPLLSFCGQTNWFSWSSSSIKPVMMIIATDGHDYWDRWSYHCDNLVPILNSTVHDYHVISKLALKFKATFGVSDFVTKPGNAQKQRKFFLRRLIERWTRKALDGPVDNLSLFSSLSNNVHDLGWKKHTGMETSCVFAIL